MQREKDRLCPKPFMWGDNVILFRVTDGFVSRAGNAGRRSSTLPPSIDPPPTG